MSDSVYDLKSFYNSKDGKLTQRLIADRLHEFWPDVKGLRVAGFGYAAPYLRGFDEAGFLGCVMMAGQGAHQWSYKGKETNLSCLVEASELPFENSSLDRILLVHDLEHSEFLQAQLAEMWRVLKPEGRMLVVVPNRGGFWSRTDWSPFGQGRPFSLSQITKFLRDNLFVYERSKQALFVPPIRRSLIRKSANFFEKYAPYAGLPGGVHVIEASKQLYGGADRGSGSRVMVRGRGIFGVPAYPSVQNTYIKMPFPRKRESDR